MSWYIIAEDRKISVKGLRKFVFPSTLPAVIKPENVIGFGVVWCIENSKPECTIIQKVIDSGVQLIDDEYQQTWEIVDKTEQELEALKNQRLSELAALRYEHETAGITVNGANIKTDRESQAMITGAFNSIQISPSVVIDWKCENEWIQLDYDSIAFIAKSVGAHVQACFTREKELAALIDIDVETDITTGWPT
jgi:hypothetical protein